MSSFSLVLLLSFVHGLALLAELNDAREAQIKHTAFGFDDASDDWGVKSSEKVCREVEGIA